MFGFRRKPAAPPTPGVTTAAEWRSRGNDALAQGQLAEAAACYRQAAQADPADAAARVNLGYVLLEQGDPQQAGEVLTAAVELALNRPELAADARFLLGRALQLRGKSLEAIASYRAALAARPAFAEAVEQLVPLLIAHGRAAEALALAKDVTCTAAHPPMLMMLAQALHATGRGEEALAALQAVLSADPQHAGALESLGNVLLELDRAQEALTSFERLMRDHGRTPEALANCSAALLRLDRQGDALARAEEALRLQPGHRPSLHNKACALLDLLRLEDARRLTLEATRLYPDDADLKWDLAVAQLLLGNLVPGWEAHEARWGAKGFAASTHGKSPVNRPRWTGAETLAGRSILLYAEQGLGDSIQFLRYVSLVAQRAKQVLLQVQPVLAPLLGSLPANCRLLRPGEAFAWPDFQCPLLSLPHAFGTSLRDVPAEIPYLHADAGRVAAWRERLPSGGKLRVGIAWSGNPRHGNDRNRSIALELFRAMDNDEVQFIGVQPQVRTDDQEALAAWPGLFDAGPQLHNFAETAALFVVLDLVVTVDTSVAHLAGALGRPVWILLPHVPDWRWMIGREDSPWYPTARLFRQPTRGDWPSVLQQVRSELVTLAQAH